MTRDMLIRELSREAASVAELAMKMGRSVSAIENDLEHIRTSIRNDHTNRLLIQPASCKLCGYMFQNSRIKAPTKCPKCNREKIKPPYFKIEIKKK